MISASGNLAAGAAKTVQLYGVTLPATVGVNAHLDKIAVTFFYCLVA